MKDGNLQGKYFGCLCGVAVDGASELTGWKTPIDTSSRTIARSRYANQNAFKYLLVATCWALASTVSLAQTQSDPRINFEPKRRAICEDYVKLLNQAKPREPMQLCGSQIDRLPGAKPLDWLYLDIPHNLELLHKMEWLLRGHIKPEPAHEFEDWLKQFQRRAKNPARLPRIKQARVTTELDQPKQLVYSYEESGPGCSAEKLVAWDKRFGAFIFFENEIQRGSDWGWKRGYPFVYDNHLHFFYSYLNDKTHYLEWTAYIDTFDGKDFRLNRYSEYKSTIVCTFHDSNIFYPPPHR